jgi:hypothetical protein
MIALERRACKFGIVRLTFVFLDRLKQFGVTKCLNYFMAGSEIVCRRHQEVVCCLLQFG